MNLRDVISEIPNFVEKFGIGKLGFYDPVYYTNSFGFSVKKSFKEEQNDKTSMLSFFIPASHFNTGGSRKPLSIRATYGRVAEDGGVCIRDISESKFYDPIDFVSNDEFYYDFDSKIFYKQNKIILAEDLIKEIYKMHLKPTRPVSGFWLRFKLFFWRFFMKEILYYFSFILSCFLYIISGIRYFYSFDSIIGTEVFGDEIEKTTQPPPKEELREGTRFEFSGYKASRWSIIFYCIAHLCFYAIFTIYDYSPLFLVRILKSNFLSLLYVVSSLWIVEAVIPRILKYLIKKSAHFSFNFFTKSIKV